MRTHRANRMLKGKIKSAIELKTIIQRLKKQNKTIVFTNGCFDLLHYGHVRFLEEAKQKGDFLVVGINSDSSVKKIKGPNRPVVREEGRIRTVAALESVDYAIIFKEKTPLKLIKLLKPDILVKGADWNKNAIVGKEIVSGHGGKVESIKLIPGYSTSNLIQKIGKIPKK